MLWSGCYRGAFKALLLFSAVFPIAVSGATVTNLPALRFAFAAFADFNNDGRADVLWGGDNNGYAYTRLYRGVETGFEETEIVLPQVRQGKAAWGDYDNDGDLDLLLAGAAGEGATTVVCRNDGAAGFTTMNYELQGNYLSSVSWVDFDNDGDLDIFLPAAGRLYRNTGGSFVSADAVFPKGVLQPSWGDYDNDSDMDLLLTGANDTSLFRNDDGSFVRDDLVLPPNSYLTGDWGDYDGDGDLDILVGAGDSSWPTTEDIFVYRNDGQGAWGRALAFGPRYFPFAASWGDFDGNGLLDVGFLTRSNSLLHVLHNAVTNLSLIITQAATGNGSLALVDINRDDRLDVFYWMRTTGQPIAAGFWTNSIAHSNTPPSAPTKPESTVTSNGEVTLSWQGAADAQTPVPGLHYNLRVGRTPGGVEVMSPHSDVVTGERRIVGRGNAGPATRWKLRELPLGTYYWSVQGIDAGFAGSPFAQEATFIITNTRPVISPITNLTTAMNVPITASFSVSDGESPASELQVVAFSSNTNVISNAGITLGGTGTNRTITIAPLTVPTGMATITIAAADPYGGVRQITVEVMVSSPLGNFLELPAAAAGAAGWADYDNDRDFDLFVSGHTLFRNDGSNQFVDIRAGLPVGGVGSAAWGDYDRDGDPDILNIGSTTEIYRNDGSDVFSGIPAGLSQWRIGNPEWRDFNGDGALDLLVCDALPSRRSVQIYQNFNGTLSRGATLPCDGLAAAAADYDNDGDLDILAAASVRSRLYANNGMGTFSEVEVMLPGLINGSVAWNDFDQDGWADIALIGSTNGPNTGVISRIYRNNGDGTFSPNPSVLEGVHLGGLAWVDQDNDGDSDLILSGIGMDGAPITRLYWNQDGAFFGSHANLPQMQPTLAWGDADGDTDLDLFLAGMIGTNRVCRIYRNDVGITNSVPQPPQNLTVDLLEDNGVLFSWAPGSDVETSDPDGLTYNLRVGTSPGAIGMMATAADLQTGFNRIPAPGNVRRGMWRLFDLPQGTYYWSVQTIDTGWLGSLFSEEATFSITNGRPSISQPPSVRIAPFETTNITFLVGDFETATEDLVLSVASSDTNVLSVTNIVFEGSGSNRTARVIAGKFPGTVTMTITVMDQNGARRSSSFRVQVEHFTLLPLTATEFGARRAVWGDYDNDGDLDLAITGTETANRGPGRVLRNDGAGSFSEVFLVELDQFPERPEWADLDNDGYLDLILAGPVGETCIYHYDRQGSFVRLDRRLGAERCVSVADYDNDGDFDVLQKGPSHIGVKTHLFRNDSRNIFTLVTTIFPDLASDGAMEWNDYDYDGDWDLLLDVWYFGLPVTGLTRLYRNDTHGIFVETYINVPVDTREVSWIDYDNDRRVDVIIGGARVFKNFGNSFSNVTDTVGLNGGNNGVWGDFDGDGWYDVMLAGTADNPSRARTFRNSANGTFAEVETSLPALREDGSAWGDYDNDGDLDLVLVGGFARLVRNNSATPNVLPSVPTNLSATVFSGGHVVFNWSPSTDSGVWASITYNLRVGTSPGGIDVMSPEADVATGWRRVARVGNAGATNFWKLWLPAGRYYWAVQAIDSSFAGSPFSEEGTFVITAPVILQQGIVAGRMNLRFSGTAGFEYFVQASQDLATWSTAGGAMEVSPGIFQFVDASANQGARFFRISSP